MSQNTFTYRRGAALPGVTLPWQEELAQDVWTDLNLTTGYTFTLTLTNTAATDVLTKTTNISGADGSVVVAWATDELDIAVGLYDLKLRAVETATAKPRDYDPKDPVQINIVA